MLYPQSNIYRSQISCPGIWQFRVDPENIGEQTGWHRGFASPIEIAVPGSWNEQLEEIGLAHYVGVAWYSTSIFIPSEWGNRKIWLRVGSADYEATVWVNGCSVGAHQGGFLPFEFDITSVVQAGKKNPLVIRVSNELSPETIPQGISSEDFESEGRLRDETYPAVRFDFFPYGGIHRPIVIHATPKSYLQGVKVDTSIVSSDTGILRVRVDAKGERSMNVRCSIEDVPNAGAPVAALQGGTASLSLKLTSCRFWSPEDPYLYSLRVELMNGDHVIDEYEMPVGVREVSVKEGKLLLNGHPIYLRGFGCHEDFPVLGKARPLPLLVKDFGLMKWIHANSFRTSHYPYSEEMMAMADRQGFLVIDEVPAVSLDMRKANENTLAAHKQAIGELIERDYNHPSVIMWALGNEPNLVGENGYHQGSGCDYWGKVFAHARSLDLTRPLTVPNCTRAGITDPVFEFSDILSLNRYYGWYEFPGRIEHGLVVLEKEIEELHQKYGKPVLMTEFGADTIPGLHSVSDQMFTEEYQASYLTEYIRLFRSKPYIVGEHVWNFADFRAPQHFRRVLLNMKGVFTRTRQPKGAAFTLKQLWSPAHSPEKA